MVGVLGFATTGFIREFDEDNFSWLKGNTTFFEGAEPDTVVPFAIDLREEERWVGFATSQRIQHANFASGLKAVLNAAVAEVGLLPADWDVDMVSSKSELFDWIAGHAGSLRVFRRTIRFSNPGRDLDSAR